MASSQKKKKNFIFYNLPPNLYNLSGKDPGTN